MIYQVEVWRQSGEKVVFTNGCFDIFHFGHLHLLREAKQYGTKLIVALNSDTSVQKLKGTQRPINKEMYRAEILAALEIVDAVVIFNEETPESLIYQLSPDVLVKGGDYALEQIAGAKYVVENGGKVKIIPLVEGFSSTYFLEMLKRI
jgi:rfaE bifunctional protein nucleotidyltransferase chain/domain